MGTRGAGCGMENSGFSILISLPIYKLNSGAGHAPCAFAPQAGMGVFIEKKGRMGPWGSPFSAWC